MYVLLTFDIIKRLTFFLHIRVFFRHRTNRPNYFVWPEYHFDIREWPFFLEIIQMYFFRNYKATGLYRQFFFMIRKRRDIHFFTLYFTARALSQVASLWRGPVAISREFKNVNERRIVGRVEFCLIKAGSGFSANFFPPFSLYHDTYNSRLHLYRDILITEIYVNRFIRFDHFDFFLFSFIVDPFSLRSIIFFLGHISRTNKHERWNIF